MPAVCSRPSARQGAPDQAFRMPFLLNLRSFSSSANTGLPTGHAGSRWGRESLDKPAFPTTVTNVAWSHRRDWLKISPKTLKPSQYFKKNKRPVIHEDTASKQDLESREWGSLL